MIDPVVQAIADSLKDEHAQKEIVADYVSQALAASEAYHSPKTVNVFKAEGEGESDTGDFDDYELAIAAILTNSWGRNAEAAAKAMIDTMGGDRLDPQRFDQAVETARYRLNNLITGGDEERLEKGFKAAARRGAAVTKATQAIGDLPQFPRLLENMVKASKYWTNEYFNTQVVPALYKEVEKLLNTGLSPTGEALQGIRGLIDERLLKRVPYWHTVSSAATSRAYHYGVIKSGRAVGYRGYRLQAVLDKRTSAICKALDRREFWLADAEQVYDQVLNADEGMLKDLHPWISGQEKSDLTEKDILSRAVYVPPFHGRCRTTMVLLY